MLVLDFFQICMCINTSPSTTFKRRIACSWHCQVLKRANFLLPFTPVTNPCYEGLVVEKITCKMRADKGAFTKGNVQLHLYSAWSYVCT